MGKRADLVPSWMFAELNSWNRYYLLGRSAIRKADMNLTGLPSFRMRWERGTILGHVTSIFSELVDFTRTNYRSKLLALEEHCLATGYEWWP